MVYPSLKEPEFTVYAKTWRIVSRAKRNLSVKWDVKERLERVENPINIAEGIVEGRV